VLLVDAATYLVAFVLVTAFVPAGRGRAAAAEDPRGMLAGVRVLLGDRLLRAWTISASLSQMGFQTLLIALPVLAFTRYGQNPRVAGLLIGAWGGGALLGSLVALRLPGRLPPLTVGSLAGLGQAPPSSPCARRSPPGRQHLDGGPATGPLLALQARSVGAGSRGGPGPAAGGQQQHSARGKQPAGDQERRSGAGTGVGQRGRSLAVGRGLGAGVGGQDQGRPTLLVEVGQQRWMPGQVQVELALKGTRAVRGHPGIWEDLLAGANVPNDEGQGGVRLQAVTGDVNVVTDGAVHLEGLRAVSRDGPEQQECGEAERPPQSAH
jgi:hypothetical protein